MARRPAAAGCLTAAGGGRRRNSPCPPTKSHIAASGCITAGGGPASIAAAGVSAGGPSRNSPCPPSKKKIAAGGCKTSGGGRSSIAAAGVAGGAAVRTFKYRCPAAAAGRLTAGGGRRRNTPSLPTKNRIATGGSKTAGGSRSSIAAAGVAGGAAVRTCQYRCPAAAAGRLTAGGHTAAGHIPVVSLLGDHVAQDGHRLSDGDHLLNCGVLGKVQSHVKTRRKHGIESFDILPQGFLKSVKCKLYFCCGVRKRRNEERETRINAIHKMIQERAGRAVSSVRECTGRPFSVRNG